MEILSERTIMLSIIKISDGMQSSLTKIKKNQYDAMQKAKNSERELIAKSWHSTFHIKKCVRLRDEAIVSHGRFTWISQKEYYTLFVGWYLQSLNFS